MIKETTSDSDFQDGIDKDLGASVVNLCERLHALEEECDMLSTTKDALQTTITETKEQLDEVAKEKSDIREKLKDARREVVALNEKRKQIQEIAENVKGTAKDLEYEKNRQVAYLEKENLHILEENKKLKKEVRSLKTEKKAAALVIQDEPTEDLGSMLSMTLSSQDKENTVNQSMQSAKPMTKAVKSQVGLGSGEGDINDECTQECQTS